MLGDLNSRAQNIALGPLMIMRWMVAFGQLMVLMSSDALWGIKLPAGPMLCLIGASVLVNLIAMTVHRGRQVTEDTVRLHIMFDIIQFSGILFLTGGASNPFSILLLAPLALAASLLSLFSLCLLIMLAVLCVSIMSFTFIPLDWPHPIPVLPAHYQQATWTALVMTLVFVSFIIWRLALAGRQINDALQETQAILAVKQQNSALGALAAAAVHELGSPLSTIAVISREMERDTHPDDPLADDIALLKTVSEKCKKILGDIARDPTRTAQAQSTMRLDRLLMELASEHATITINVVSRTPENLPNVLKTANLEYGLGNLIGNAASFSTVAVTITAEASAEDVTVVIQDDGPGFPPDVLRQIGSPYISSRDNKDGHLGLGIFIAVNLLDAAAGQLAFSNAPNGGGRVTIIWPRAALDLDAPQQGG